MERTAEMQAELDTIKRGLVVQELTILEAAICKVLHFSAEDFELIVHLQLMADSLKAEAARAQVA